MSEPTASDQELTDLLASARPSPSARFREALARHLAQRDPRYGPRPPLLRMMVAIYLIAGATLIAVGALVATRVL